MKQVIELTVNGEPYEVGIHPNCTLLEVLREEIGLTGPKEGCGLGACGSCTVLIDGKAVLACLTLALSVEGRDIQTVGRWRRLRRRSRRSWRIRAVTADAQASTNEGLAGVAGAAVKSRLGSSLSAASRQDGHSRR